MNARHRRLTHCFAAPSIVIAAFTLAVPSHAGTIFYDDFEDGDHLDGSPVSWDFTDGDPDDEEMVVDGSLVLTSTGIETLYSVNWAGVDLDLADVSIRAQGRAGHPIDVIAVNARGNPVTEEAYYVRVGHAEGWDTPVLGVSVSPASIWIPTDLDPYQEDVVLQLDVFGNQISAWAWRPGEDMPDAPLIATTDNSFTSGGVSLSVWNNPLVDEPVEAIFRYVHVADVHIHPGDFDNDGRVDDDDLLIWEQGLGMHPNAAPADGDADYDGDVDRWDFLMWQREYGTVATLTTPEPTTSALALAATLFYFGRRRV